MNCPVTAKQGMASQILGDSNPCMSSKDGEFEADMGLVFDTSLRWARNRKIGFAGTLASTGGILDSLNTTLAVSRKMG